MRAAMSALRRPGSPRTTTTECAVSFAPPLGPSGVVTASLWCVRLVRHTGCLGRPSSRQVYACADRFATLCSFLCMQANRVPARGIVCARASGFCQPPVCNDTDHHRAATSGVLHEPGCFLCCAASPEGAMYLYMRVQSPWRSHTRTRFPVIVCALVCVRVYCSALPCPAALHCPIPPNRTRP